MSAIHNARIIHKDNITLRFGDRGIPLNAEQIRNRAAIAYDKYQKCGLRGAHRLFTTGW
jgi:hypothetical protein